MAHQTPNSPIYICGEMSMIYKNIHNMLSLEIETFSCDCFKSGNKVHFYQCQVVVENNIIEKIDMTNEDGVPFFLCNRGFFNDYYIYTTMDKKTVKVRLPLCKYCLSIFFRKANISCVGYPKNCVAECGDVKKLMKCVRSLHENNRHAEEDVRKFMNECKNRMISPN